MNVTPSSPLEASRGLCVSPQRGVTAECRTSRPNCDARLRRAGLRSDALIILKWPTRWMNSAGCWFYFSSDYPSKNHNSCGSRLAFSIRARNHRQIKIRTAKQNVEQPANGALVDL